MKKPKPKLPAYRHDLPCVLLAIDPMTTTGCSTMGACPGDRCVTGSMVITGCDIVTIFLSPGEDASGHRITVRHEMAHALSGCTTGSLDSGHADRRVWDGIVWQK